MPLPPSVVSAKGFSLARAMHDLGELSLLNPDIAPAAQQAHAIVLGGSWTGLLTAAVLSPYFKRITILERDSRDATLNNPTGVRRGVPHGGQSHVVLPYAVRFVSTLLPHFNESLRAAGAEVGGDLGMQFRWYQRGAWRPHHPLHLPMWFASRACVERTLRRDILATFANVHFDHDAQAVGLVMGPNHCLAGVRVQRGHEEEVVLGDFVADCMGKHSQAAKWLEGVGVTPVREVNVDAKTFYATCRYQRTQMSVREHGHFASTMHGHAESSIGGHFAGAVTVENDDLMVWAIRAGAKPPGDTEALNGFLKSLEVGDYYTHANKHVSHTDNNDVNVFSAGPAKRRAYERLRDLPQNFAALGDAACATDPAFGLGLSLSASTVSCLAAALHRRWAQNQNRPWPMRGLGRELAKRVAWRVYLPWWLTAAEDYRFAHTRGPHKDRLWVRFLQNYIDRAFKAAHHDAEVDGQVLRVVGLVSHPLNVFGPLVFSRVLQSI